MEWACIDCGFTFSEDPVCQSCRSRNVVPAPDGDESNVLAGDARDLIEVALEALAFPDVSGNSQQAAVKSLKMASRKLSQLLGR